jgi:DNA-binding transcriptional regulator GbsR (MarR family)
MKASVIHTDGIQEFVEAIATVAERSWGMSRTAGRVWATLLTTDRNALTTDDLMTALGASRGSVSTILRTLEQIGIVQRVSMPGDRKHYFRAPSAATAIEMELASIETLRKLMAKALVTLPHGHNTALERLREYHDLLAFFQDGYGDLIRRWNARTQKRKQQ